MGGKIVKACPACGNDSMVHSHGEWNCVVCQYKTAHNGGYQHRRGERRYKKALRRLDKIGARLAGLR